MESEPAARAPVPPESSKRFAPPPRQRGVTQPLDPTIHDHADKKRKRKKRPKKPKGHKSPTPPRSKAKRNTMQALLHALTNQDKDKEERRLDAFLLQHASSYAFPSDHAAPLCQTLIQDRLLHPTWQASATRAHRLRTLQAVRVLTRDPAQLAQLVATPTAIHRIVADLGDAATLYFGGAQYRLAYVPETLVELTSLVKRIAAATQPCCVFDTHTDTNSDAGMPHACPGMPAWECLLQCNAHHTLCLLLAANAADSALLHTVLVALLNFAQHASFVHRMVNLNVMEPLLSILAHRDHSSTLRCLTAEFLDVLLENQALRAECQMLSGNSVLLSVVSYAPPSALLTSGEDSDAAEEDEDTPPAAEEWRPLVLHALHCLSNMTVEVDSAREVQYVGGIALLLSLLSTGDASSVPVGLAKGASAAAACSAKTAISADVAIALCVALTQLAVDDETSLRIRQANGVFVIGRLFCALTTRAHAPRARLAQVHAIRALRFLYSLERNRSVFKTLFPPAFFARFIDIGHFVHSLTPYQHLVEAHRTLSSSQHAAMLRAVYELADDRGVGKPPARCIGAYEVEDTLGKGAYGTVFRVRRVGGRRRGGSKRGSGSNRLQSGSRGGSGSESGPERSSASGVQSACDSRAETATGSRRFALKELPLVAPTSKTLRQDVDALVDEVCKEVDIISRLRHPCIVKYYTSFVQDKALYIVMELVNGPTLADHFRSLAEKGARMAERDIWALVVQLCQALTYLHSEKRVVHRDLTPSNIVLSGSVLDERGKTSGTEEDPAGRTVKITDFGLASLDQTVMNRAVGTISYACPEIVMDKPYTSKADIWSLGCLMYHMAANQSPFAATNPLMAARKIVEGRYAPLDKKVFSPLFIRTVQCMLETDPEKRLDIHGVNALIAPRLVDALQHSRRHLNKMERMLRYAKDRHDREADEWSRQEQVWRRVMAGVLPTSAQASVFPHSPHGALHRHVPGGVSGAGSPALDLLTSPRHKTRRVTAVPEEEHPDASPTPPTPPPQSPIFRGRSAGWSGGRSAGRSGSGGRWGTTLSDGPTMLSPAASPGPRASNFFMRIPQERLRAITDPCDLILRQLHKLVFISQLPPTLHRNATRSLLAKYKHALFSPQFRHLSLKEELKAILSASPMLIDMELGLQGVRRAFSSKMGAAAAEGDEEPTVWPNRITHEDVHVMIEQVLADTNYYDMFGGDAQRLVPQAASKPSPAPAPLPAATARLVAPVAVKSNASPLLQLDFAAPELTNKDTQLPPLRPSPRKKPKAPPGAGGTL